MKYKKIILNKEKATKKLNVKTEIFDWICLVKGIFPFYSRKFNEKKKTTYFSKNNVNLIKKDPIIEKIKKIEIWKKSLSKIMNNSFERQKQSKVNLFPCYNFECIVIERFDNFSMALKYLNELFFFVFFLSNESVFRKYYKKTIETDVSSVSKFFFQINPFMRIKYIFNSTESFFLGILISGKNYRFTFPKKKFFNIKKLKDFKITHTFSELNSGLFSLIYNKFKKINYVLCPKTNTSLSLSLLSSKLFSRMKYYILSVKKKKFSIETTSILKEKHVKFHKTFRKINLKKIFLKKKFWVFSKNINFPCYNCYIKGLVFYFGTNFDQIGLYLHNLTIVIKGYQTQNKSGKNTIFYFSVKNYFDRSLISIYLKIDWIGNSINCKTLLPLIPYSLKSQKIMNINPFFLKFFRKNRRKMIRIKTKKQKIQVREQSFKIKINFVIKNYKKKRYPSVDKETPYKKLLISSKFCLIYF